MNVRLIPKFFFLAIFFFVFVFTSCRKNYNGTPVNNDACAGKSLVVSTTFTNSDACTNNGSITATVTGSTGFTYKLNANGTYQASGAFINLGAATYNVFAKDGAGCEKSVVVTVAGAGTPGALFSAVKGLVASRCQSCHNTSNANGGMNFDIECNIIVNEARIKVRAVDEGTMPQTGPLPQSEKDVITNWINAGGGFSN